MVLHTVLLNTHFSRQTRTAPRRDPHQPLLVGEAVVRLVLRRRLRNLQFGNVGLGEGLSLHVSGMAGHRAVIVPGLCPEEGGQVGMLVGNILMYSNPEPLTHP